MGFNTGGINWDGHLVESHLQKLFVHGEILRIQVSPTGLKDIPPD